MMRWLHHHTGLLRACALLFFVILMVAGILGGEHRLFRIEAATL